MTRTQKLVLGISILASFVAFLDSSVVNVALPAITKELGGGLAAQQWVVDAYLIALGSLMLLAGSLSDLFGRKRILRYGLIGFGATSLLCAIAPNVEFLIGARALQGIAGALLVPSSLALIISTFSGSAQGKAIGSWTAWTGISFIVGPLLGGFLVDTSSWRLVFGINILPVILCLILLRMLKVQEHTKHIRVDMLGAFLCSAGLSGSVFALIEQPKYGWTDPLIYIPFIASIALLVWFIVHEKRSTTPMINLRLFKVRNFSAGNIATVGIYGGLSIATFLIAIYLQQVSGYSALAAGAALMPVTIIMFFLSSKFGALSSTFGPRICMTVGPIIAGIGFALLALMPEHPQYWLEVFPGVVLFGIGLSATVAPLTTAVLSDIPKAEAGIGSAINNAVARIAGLLTIALSGVIIGAQLTPNGYKRAMLATTILMFAGGVASWLGIRNSTTRPSGAPDANR